MSLTEKKNKKKSMRRSIIIHLLLLLIFFLYSFKAEPAEIDPDKPPYPVVVDFTYEESSNSTYAHADVGKSRPKSTAVERVEASKPKEIEVKQPEVKVPETKPVVTTTPTDPVVSETTVDDSPVEAAEEEVVIDIPVEEDVPVEEPVEEVVKVDPPTPTKSEGTIKITKPGEGNSTSSELPSKTDGTGVGKGDTGKGKGSDAGNDNTSGKGNKSDGTGEYDGSGQGIFGRRVIKKNYKELPFTHKGKITVKTCINRAGSVTFAELIEDETTITDRKVLKQALSASYGYKFQPDLKAPREQCGKLYITLSGDAIPSFNGN